MDKFENIDLLECPICGGTGMIEVEAGWCVYVQCIDCGSHTAEVAFDGEEQKLTAARRAADTWNFGKVVAESPGT